MRKAYNNINSKRVRKTMVWWVVLMVVVVVVMGEQQKEDNHDNNTTTDWLKEFVSERSGGINGNGIAVWSYEGQYIDPRTGHIISRVEGLELIRQLSMEDNNDLLSASDLISANNNNKEMYSGTVLSRKLFCHLHPNDDTKNNNDNKDNHNDGTILHRIRPFGNPSRPWKYIPFHQAISIKDTAITYLNPQSNDQKRMFSLHTEWSNGNYITSHATTTNTFNTNNNDDTTLEFSVQLPQRISKRRPVLFSLLSPNKNNNNNDNNNRIPRSTFIQFGKSPNSGDGSTMLLPARETYKYQWQKSPFSPNKNPTIRNGWFQSIFSRRKENKTKNNENSRMTLYYTRQGEAPPWYGPGQSVVLELKGTRLTSLNDVPSNTVARLAAKNIPGFATVLTPIKDTKRAIQWFKKDKPLQVLMDNLDHNNNPMQQRYQSIEQWIHRIIAATKLTSGTSHK